MSEPTVSDFVDPEEWRDVPEWPAYQASSAGRIRSRARGPWRTMALAPQGNYLCVTLCRPGCQLRWPAHRVIAVTFHGPAPFPGALVRHLNDRPHDNRAVNLAWGTPKQNAEDAARNRVFRRGESNPMTKLTPRLAYEIFCRVAGGQNRDAVAADFGVSISTVSHIMTGRKWRLDMTEAGYVMPPFNPRSIRRLNEDEAARVVALRLTGATLAGIAKATGIPLGTVSPIVSGNEPRWWHLSSCLPPNPGRTVFTDDEVRAMVGMRAAGKSYREIADHLGGGIASVYRILNGRRKSYRHLLSAG